MFFEILIKFLRKITDSQRNTYICIKKELTIFKESVMNAKIAHFSELSNILGDKNAMCKDFIRLIGQFGIASSLSRIGMEKEKGAKVSDLLSCLIIFRLCGMSVFESYQAQFMSLINGGKNQFYRLLVRPNMNWRKLLLGICKTFFRIVEKKSIEKLADTRYYILDDTTLEKTGYTIEGIGKVFDHVFQRYVLGFKCQVLAISDKVSTLVVDFSMHAEATKKGNYGLTSKQLKNRTVIKRKDGDCLKNRVKELDEQKPAVALEMIRRAWKNGIHASYLLMDKWYFGIDLIRGVRKIADGAIHIVTLLRDKRTKFQYDGKEKSARELMLSLGKNMKSCRKYKCRWVSALALYQDIPVRLFFVKYGHATDFEVIVTTDTKLKFVEAFETYQIRWSIEVINKECKQYLGLGSQQSTNMNAQFADATIVFMGYNMLTLAKRFSDYETLGGLFHEIQKETLELTFFERTLPLIVELLTMEAELLGYSIDDVIERAMVDEAYNHKLLCILNSYQDVKEHRA